MATRESGVPALLDAVRRHLWREQGRRAVRQAAWLSAATTLGAGALHLAVSGLRVDAVLWLLGLEWAGLLAAAAWRRPTDADCALWIDRHLGGASAFMTLLEPAASTRTPAQAQAVRWLERWAAAQVPFVLQGLGARRSSVRLARPLLSMAVCSALALFVLNVPDSVPNFRRQASAPAAAAPDEHAAASVPAPVAAELASEIAHALRSPDSPSEPERRRAGDAPTTGPTRDDDSRASSAPASRATQTQADASTSRDSRSLVAADASASAGPGQSADTVSGRDAGDSPDARADRAVSRGPTGTIAAVRAVPTLPLAAAERQADMDQAAAFDDSGSAPGSATPGAIPTAAAAAPPQAIAAARWSAAETSYVQAWMKATGRSR